MADTLPPLDLQALAVRVRELEADAASHAEERIRFITANAELGVAATEAIMARNATKAVVEAAREVARLRQMHERHGATMRERDRADLATGTEAALEVLLEAVTDLDALEADHG